MSPWRVFIKTDHPLDPEFIGEHSEIVAPEGFVHRHRDLASGRKAIEIFIGIFLAVRVDGYRKVIAPGKMGSPFTPGVAAHEHGFLADRQADVHDFFGVFGRKGFAPFGGHFLKSPDIGEFPSEYGFVKIEGFFAVSVEGQVNVNSSHMKGF